MSVGETKAGTTCRVVILAIRFWRETDEAFARIAVANATRGPFERQDCTASFDALGAFEVIPQVGAVRIVVATALPEDALSIAEDCVAYTLALAVGADLVDSTTLRATGDAHQATFAVVVARRLRAACSSAVHRVGYAAPLASDALIGGTAFAAVGAIAADLALLAPNATHARFQAGRTLPRAVIIGVTADVGIRDAILTVVVVAALLAGLAQGFALPRLEIAGFAGVAILVPLTGSRWGADA